MPNTSACQHPQGINHPRDVDCPAASSSPYPDTGFVASRRRCVYRVCPATTLGRQDPGHTGRARARALQPARGSRPVVQRIQLAGHPCARPAARASRTSRRFLRTQSRTSLAAIFSRLACLQVPRVRPSARAAPRRLLGKVLAVRAQQGYVPRTWPPLVTLTVPYARTPARARAARPRRQH